MITPDDPIPTEEKTPNHTRNIPVADVDLMDVAKKVSQTWGLNPLLTLLWLSQLDFDALVILYSTTLMERKSTGGERPEFTGKLIEADAEIDTGVEIVKGYLNDKYTKKKAPDYYAAFGIEKTYKGYKLPIDHNDRKAALELLVAAITTHGFQNNTYGLAYWTALLAKFKVLLEKTETIDGSVSTKVGNKNVLKKEIRKALNALINLLKANYPDTWKTELRNWGFQKEKY